MHVEPTTERPTPLAPEGVSYGAIALGLTEIVFDLIHKRGDRKLVLLAYQAAANALSLIDVLLDRQMGLIDQMDLAPRAQVDATREGTIAAKRNLNILALSLDDLMITTGMLSKGGRA